MSKSFSAGIWLFWGFILKTGHYVLLFLGLCLVSAYFLFDLGELVTLARLKELAGVLPASIEQKPVYSALIFFGIYVLMAALSLPGAAVMTIAAGALFGFGWGLFLASFASSIGAALAFLVARTLLGPWVEDRFGEKLKTINAGLADQGNFYLFSIRMVPGMW